MKKILPEDDFPITKEELQFIVAAEYEKIESLAIYNSFCSNCYGKEGNQMKIHSLYLLRNNAVLFQGNCTVCNGNMARVIETGEQPQYRINMDIVRAKRNNKN